MLYPDENIDSVRAWLSREYDAPLIGTIPHLTPALPERAALHIDIERLLSRLRTPGR
jgi:dethiobiotin synthetase